ncbi:SOS response-associated peptidase [Prosthecomicrobium pneumaticum]|uniref:Abasic site processing protein n=1 Tax=Prosthecomicrobium pneumaticum TaxID=81895 RepID=A0A7W9CU39_9HYPH|nr:SOS response-associated peptidase [Prosthecomicrobium pneumaticum]MBB5751940.1 putative SOS response-associated peptidase YedK [Prosthecomicrobium pneumaticum]
MCGRFSLTADARAVMEEFSVTGLGWLPPRYNIAPTQPVLVIRAGRHGREAVLMRWGLIPRWAKDPSRLPLLFNARAETLAEKPAFRGALRHRRVVLPASGFYEWRRSADGKRRDPYYIRPRGGGLLALAGLAEDYADDKGNEIDTVTIVTTPANATLAPIHDRMPAILSRDAVAGWIGGDLGGAALPVGLLAPAPADLLEAIPVGPRVNRAAADDAGLQERVERAEPAAGSEAPADATPPAGPSGDPQLDLF